MNEENVSEKNKIIDIRKIKRRYAKDCLELDV